MRATRFAAIDVLRGFVMLLMTIDHASEVFNAGRVFTDSALFYKPGTPLPAGQFFLRWITHLCAPTFVFLAGTSLAISASGRKARGDSGGAIDRHILVRGLTIILFEVMWMSPVMVKPGRFLFQVLYAIGASLICMIGVRRLSNRAVMALGFAILCGLEILDNVVGSSLPAALVAQPGFFFNRHLIVAYPILPWLAMMCLGWAFGKHLVAKGPGVLLPAGAIALLVFVVVRFANGYGNMHLLREDASLVQWFHVSKYPPSITFAALELGIMAVLLGALFIHTPRFLLPLTVLGEVALFYYLLHIHVLELFAWISGYGEKLGVRGTLIAALVVALMLYPLCILYRRAKRAHPRSLLRFV